MTEPDQIEQLVRRLRPLPSVPPVTQEERAVALVRQAQEAERPTPDDANYRALQSLADDLGARLNEAGVGSLVHLIREQSAERVSEIRSQGEAEGVTLDSIFEAVSRSQLANQSDWEGVTYCEVLKSRVGPYFLASAPATQCIEKTTRGPFRCAFPQFNQLPSGFGPTIEEAREDLHRRVHFLFQRLAALEDYERSEKEQAEWEQLTALIDVGRYEAGRRRLRHAVGQIRKVPQEAGVPEASSGDRDWRIQWDGEAQEQPFALERVPLEFARLRPGQWFEALVELDPATRVIHRVLHAQVTYTPPEPQKAPAE